MSKMNTLKFEKNILAVGDDYVAVQIIDNNDHLVSGGIHLLDSYESNARLAFAKVLKVGKTAFDKIGIKEDDYVFIDRLATFGHTAPIATLKYDSVIYRSNDNKSEFFPLKNMIFVENDKKPGPEEINGVFVINNQYKLHTGTIIAMNTEDTTFKVGDKVILSKGADHVQIGDREISIFKNDMIVATIEE